MMRSASALLEPASAHRCLLRRRGVRLRLTTIAASTSSIRLPSFTLAAVTMSDNGTPRPSTSRCRLLPFFSPVRRVGPDGLLRHRCLEECSVNALPSPGDAFHLVVLGQTSLPYRFEEACFLPLQEALVHCAGTAKTFLGQSLPLAARAQHVHDGLEHLARRLGRSARSGLVHVCLACHRYSLGYERLNPRPELVRHHPRINPFGCHPSTPPPRLLRLGRIVYYLRISSKVAAVLAHQTQRAGEP